MFFRNQTAKVLSFSDRLATLRSMGFSVYSDSDGGSRVIRGRCAASIQEGRDGTPEIQKVGILIGQEIGVLSNGGYQMFLRTDSGKELPAQADHLREIHSCDEDLREGLGLTSLYNQGLGTVSKAHMYDRVEERDEPHHPRPWER